VLILLHKVKESLEMKYAIEMKIYNNGKVEMSEIKEVSNECKSTFKSDEKCDYYFDVFNTKKEALKFIEENKED
jgi:hypothetical protein